VVWKRGLHDDQGLEKVAAPATAEEWLWKRPRI
jgi:hypothetical protein